MFFYKKTNLEINIFINQNNNIIYIFFINNQCLMEFKKNNLSLGIRNFIGNWVLEIRNF